MVMGLITLAGLHAAPAQTPPPIERAHDELFLGNVEKSKGIYLANKERIDPAKGITFAQIVLTDFRLLREAGVTHPGMDEIETLMRNP